MRRRTRLIASAVTGALLALTAFAVTAGAQSGIKVSHYPPSSAAVDSGAWVPNTAKTGLTCILAPLTCPTPTQTFVSGPGGQGGSNGWLKTSFTQLIPAAADVFAGWTSPTFVYNGAEGKDPTELSLSLFRKFHCDFPLGGGCALVDPSVVNQVVYTVAIVDPANGDIVATPFDNRTARLTEGWSKVESSIDPDDLTVGGTYQIVIVTEVKTTAQVLPDPNT